MRASRKQLTPGDKYVPWESEIAFSSIPLGSVARINTDALGERTEPSRILRYLDISSVSSDGKIGEPAEFEFANAPSRARRVLRSKDTIVSTVRTYLRAIAFVEDEFSDCIASTGFAVLSPRRVNPKFLYYWMRSEWMVQEVSARSIGVGYPAINADILGSLPIPKLTAEQQSRVVAFLDKRTAAIDQLIAKKQRMVELLQEKRLALISQAVTKGLDTNADMKSSGVAWLGDVPEHWEVSRLKSGILSAKNGVWGQDASGSENDVVCVRVADFDRQGFVSKRKAKTMREVDPEQFDSRNLKSGDILLEKSGGGEKQPVGFAVLFDAEGRAVCSNFVARVRLNSSTDPLFTVYLLAHLYHSRVNVRSIKQSTGIQNLDSEQYFQELVAWPPLNEQIQIGAFLKTKSAAFLEAMAKIEGQCELLREYRRTLITAAVTGKIDVTAERSGSA